MMKKVLLTLLSICSLFLFSCKTTQTNDENISEDITYNLETLDEELHDDENNFSQENEDSDEEQLSDNLDESNNFQDSEEKTSLVSEIYPELGEIEEPEVIEISIEDIIAEEEKKREQEELLEKQRQEELENQKSVEEQLTETDIDLPEPLEFINEDNSKTTQESDVSPDIHIISENDDPNSLTNEETDENQIETSEEDTADEEELEPEEEVIIPSRSVTLRKGELLIVTYPGNGWIYMGSTSEYNNMTSRGRKLGSTDTVYTLQAKESGTQIHHFYKVDNLTGDYIDDYLEVIVLDKKGTSSTKINAPEYKSIVPKKAETPAKSTKTKEKENALELQNQYEAQTSLKNDDVNNNENQSKDKKEEKKNDISKTNSNSKTSSQQKAKNEDFVSNYEENEEEYQYTNNDDVEFLDDSEDEAYIDLQELMSTAQKAYQNKNYKDAYDSLNLYLEHATEERDTALFLLAKILESESEYENILGAINTYQMLCDNYPASIYWDEANKRIIYLKRFYIDIH